MEKYQLTKNFRAIIREVGPLYRVELERYDSIEGYEQVYESRKKLHSSLESAYGEVIDLQAVSFEKEELEKVLIENNIYHSEEV